MVEKKRADLLSKIKEFFNKREPWQQVRLSPSIHRLLKVSSLGLVESVFAFFI